jgi:hypothetical protein
MARDEKRKQKARMREAAKQNQRHKKRARTPVAPSGPRAVLRQAAKWPLYECLVSRDWNREGELVQVLVARRSPVGEIAAAAFVVDLGCLGVKHALATLCDSLADYAQLRRDLMASQPMVNADLDLAAKIIQEGIGYARQFGFRPDPDYYEAAVLLAGANPEACDAQVPLGTDGKPFFAAGPYDDAEKVMAQLTRVVGPGNFDYLVPLGAPPDWINEDDEV